MTTITHAELAALYNISCRTLFNWFIEANIERQKHCTISLAEQQQIFDYFGDPALSISRAALADAYDIDRRTLYNWFKKVGIDIRTGCAICWKHQAVIHKTFGDPSVYEARKRAKAEKRALEQKRKKK
jgi:hypothetical protein